MEWRLFADIAEAAGTHSVALDIDGDASVADALDELLERHPDLRELVLVDGDLADHLTVLRNGENVAGAHDGLDTPVENGDELALFPPISGG